MPKAIDDKLVLAISSRALFDLSESHKVYPVSYTHLTLPTNREV